MSSIVVFDIGGVLVPEGSRMQQLHEHVALLMGEFHREKFTAAYWGHRSAYDLGCADEEFWVEVLAAAGFAPSAMAGAIPTIAARDAELNSTIAPGPEALLRELHEVGVPLAVLSNAPRRMAEAVRAREWGSYFTVLGFSSLLGAMKPSEQAYGRMDELLDEVVGLPEDTRNVHFLDDRSANVEGAIAHGWSAHLWTSVEDSRDAFVDVGLIPVSTRSGE